MKPAPPALSHLWKTGSIYVFSFWLNSALPLLLTPILTRFLTPADYGASAMWQMLLNFAAPVVGVSVNAAVNLRYFQTSGDPVERHREMRDYIASVVPILAISFAVVTAAFALGYGAIARQILDVSPAWILAVPVVALATCVCNIVLAYLNASMQARNYAFLLNGQSLAITLIGLMMIVGFGWHWQGRVLGNIAGVLLAAAASLLYLRRAGLLGGTVRRDYLLHALAFSLPLLPHTLCSVGRGISDRMFLSQITNLSEIGLFSVALSLASIFNTLGSAAQQAWIPWLYGSLKAPSPNRYRIVRTTYVAIAGLCILGAAFALLAPSIFGLLLGPRFAESTRFIWWLTAAMVLQGAYYFLAPYLAYVERTSYSSYISLTTLAVNLGLNVVLIHYFGVLGVAMANFFTALYEFIAVFVVAHYFMPMPWISAFFRSAPALGGTDTPINL